MGRSFQLRTSLVVLGLAGLIGFVSLRRSETPKAPDPSQDDPVAPPADDPLAALVEAPSIAPSARTGAEVSVVSRAGEPVAGVVAVFLTGADVDARARAWPTPPDGETVSTFVTDEGGKFPPAWGEAAARAELMWIMHPGHLASAIELGSEGNRRSLTDPIVLDPAPPFLARVVHADGSVAPGAVVSQRLDLTFAGDVSAGEARLEASFLHRASADPSGVVALVPTSPRSCASARLGTLQTSWWRGASSGTVELVLDSTFVARGRIDWGADASAPAGARIECSVPGVDGDEPIATLAVTSGGWGPIELPLHAPRPHLFRLCAPGYAAAEKWVDPPAAGASLSVDFRAERATSVTVLVVDETDQPIGGATVVGNWAPDGRWVRRTTTTDERGFATFEDAHPAFSFVRVSKPGFEPYLGNHAGSAESMEAMVRIVMAPAGTIAGRVTFAGTPVDRFVVHLHGEDPNNYLRRSFTDPAGRFRIDEAPLGSVTIAAVSDQYSHSEPQTLTVTKERTTEVELELSSPLAVRGRVVDGMTGTSLRNASVQVFSTIEGLRFRPFGLPQPVLPDGSFLLRGCAPGDNSLEVAAPGYAATAVRVVAADGAEADVGLVGLYPRSSLEVRLVGPPSVDFAKYKAEISGTRFFAERRFPSDGRLRWEELDPDAYVLHVRLPVRYDPAATFDVVVEPGRDAVVEIPIADRRVTVRVLPSPGTEMPQWPQLWVHSQAFGTHPSDQGYWVDASGEVELVGLPPGPILAEVRTQDDEMLAFERFEVPVAEHSSFEIRIDEPSHALRLLDRDGDPIAGATIDLTSPAGPASWHRLLRTDEVGTVKLTAMPFDVIGVSAYHASKGMLPRKQVDLRASDTTTLDVVLDGGRTLQVLAAERGQGAAGVRLRARDLADFAHGLGETSTNEVGIATWPAVSAGDYRIAVEQPGYFPARIEATLGTSGSPIHLEVRRVGGIELTVADRLGHPIEKAVAVLTATEGGTSVADWITKGLVVSSSADLRTGLDGTLRVEGLPNGPFQWKVTAPDGRSAEGSSTVGPSSTASVHVVVE